MANHPATRWRPSRGMAGAVLLAVTAASHLSVVAGPSFAASAAPLSVALSADTEGSLYACESCGEGRLGGLEGRAEVVAKLREAHREVLLVDAGNALLGAETLESRGRPVLEAYERMGYTAANLGFRDFRLGKAVTVEIVRSSKLQLVSANLIDADTGQLIVRPYVVVEAGGQRVAVLGLTQSPPGLDSLPHLQSQLAGIRIRAPAEALAEWLPKAQAEAGVVLLVYYGSPSSLRPLRERFGPQLAAILVGGAPPDRLPGSGNPPVVGALEQGRALTLLELGPAGAKVESLPVRGKARPPAPAAVVAQATPDRAAAGSSTPVSDAPSASGTSASSGTAPGATLPPNGSTSAATSASGSTPVASPADMAAVIPPNGSLEQTPVAPEALTPAPGAPALTETEPNDKPEQAQPLAGAFILSGTLDGNRDWFAWTLSPEDAAKRWSLVVQGEARKRINIALLRDQNQQMDSAYNYQQARAGWSDLRLDAGTYLIRLEANERDLLPYALTATADSPDAPGREVEPNSESKKASAIPPDGVLQGRFVGFDEDRVLLETAPPAGLWSVEVEGDTIESLAMLSPADQIEQSTRRQSPGPIRLSNLYLLPGNHVFTVRGEGGDYVIRTRRQGPPPPGFEREPNDDKIHAEPLQFDEKRVSNLESPNSVDVYRFSLFADEHVALNLTSHGAGTYSFWMEWGDTRVVNRRDLKPDQPVRYEAWLSAGDYFVSLFGSSGEAAVDLRLERLDPFDLPADLAPNDQIWQARPFPETGEVSGTLDDPGDPDVYSLPVMPDAAEVAVQIEGDAGLILNDAAGANVWKEVKQGVDPKTWTVSMPAGQARFLRISGSGAYRVHIQIAGRPPVPAPQPPRVQLQVRLASNVVAAYRRQAQKLAGEVELNNQDTVAWQPRLDVRTSHLRWQARLSEAAVAIGPGERRVVPIEVEVPADATPRDSIRVSVRAIDSKGAQVTGGTTVTARPEATMVAAHRYSALPEKLLGAWNVALTSLGAKAIGEKGPLIERQLNLMDGLAAPQIGFWAEGRELPIELTIDLATDDPVPVVGMALNPRSFGWPSETVKDFDFLLSEDGSTFKTVLSATLNPLPVEQGFVLEAPISAKYARLRLRSSYWGNGYRVFLGEWKVLAFTDTIAPAGADLTDPATGGHVVWLDPQLTGWYEPLDKMLSGKSGGDEFTLEPGATASWAVAFNEERAARVTEVQWRDAPNKAPERAIGEVEIATAPDSPLGPWTSVGTFKLDRGSADAEGWMSFRLAAPVWGRFVRFSVSSRSNERLRLAIPGGLRILEQPSNASYRSILTEWGDGNPGGPFEAQEKQSNVEPEVPALPPPLEGGWVRPRKAPAAVNALALGTEVHGTVEVGVKADEYELDVPEGANVLRVRLGGDPTVSVRVELKDAAGKLVELRSESLAPTEQVWKASVLPGRHRLRVEEPPRSILIAWDNSGSMSDYLPRMYAALPGYADEIQKGREALQLLPFGGTPLLTDWSDDPGAIQRTLNDYDRKDQSSDAELTLIRAAKELRQRAGVRAIVLLTDAESGSFNQTAECWTALGEVRPRIFGLTLGKGQAYRRSKQLMDAWAAVNGGQNVMVSTHADLDVGFDRALRILRRPAEYGLVAEASFEKPPGPGRLQVVSAPAGPKAAPVLAAGAIELILDASGSMLQSLEGRRRIDVAKAVLTELVTQKLPARVPLAFRVFGHRKANACDTELRLPLRPLEPRSVATMIGSLKAMNLAKTPIADSLRLVAQDLAAAKGQRIVVLVTDGEETCGGDPLAEIQKLRAQGLDVRVSIVGFTVEDIALEQQFRAWAEAGAGNYFRASGSEELSRSLEQALRPGFRVLAADGKVVASGQLDGPEVELPAGTYVIEVETAPPKRFDAVEIPPDGQRRLEVQAGP